MVYINRSFFSSGTVLEGKISAQKPKENWVDCIKEDRARAHISYGSWTEKAKNRTTWQKTSLFLICQGEIGPLFFCTGTIFLLNIVCSS
jgi:hypothetical protein